MQTQFDYNYKLENCLVLFYQYNSYKYCSYSISLLQSMSLSDRGKFILLVKFAFKIATDLLQAEVSRYYFHIRHIIPFTKN
jgi:hypothetical protein